MFNMILIFVLICSNFHRTCLLHSKLSLYCVYLCYVIKMQSVFLPCASLTINSACRFRLQAVVAILKLLIYTLPGAADLFLPAHHFYIVLVTAPCGLQGCKNGPTLFPGRMSYKATKPGLVCLSYLSMLYYCVVVYQGTFLCIVSFCCCVFCLLVVLAKLSLLAK